VVDLALCICISGCLTSALKHPVLMRVREFVVDFREAGQSDNMRSYFQFVGLN
jgi:hypothetical protein